MNPKKQKRKTRKVASREAKDAWDAVQDGNLDLALKCARRAVARAEDSPAVWTDYSRILALAGRLTEAEKAARNAILFGPQHAEAQVCLAEVLALKGLSIEAWRAQKRAVALKPQVPLYRDLLERYEKALPRKGGGNPEADPAKLC